MREIPYELNKEQPWPKKIYGQPYRKSRNKIKVPCKILWQVSEDGAHAVYRHPSKKATIGNSGYYYRVDKD